MAKDLQEFKVKNFTTGLNVVDSALNMADSDVVVADNVDYTDTGGVKSVDGLTQVGNDIYVNGLIATKILGGKMFNGKFYMMASNGSESRLVYKNDATSSITAFADAGGGKVTVTSASHGLMDGDYVTISGTTNYNGSFVISSTTTNTFDITDTWVANDATGTWTCTIQQANAQNFSATAEVEFEVYNDILWFVNGLETNSNVLNFLSTSNVLTGLTTAASGLPTGMTNIILHLERIWIAAANTLYITKVRPTGVIGDWDTTSAYTGADVAGAFVIDNDTEDAINGMKIMYSSLVVNRRYSIWLLTGKTVLQVEMARRTNAKIGVLSGRSASKADVNMYFLSDEGIKVFNGQTVKEGTTNVDTLSTDRLDRKIATLIDAGNTTTMVGYAFRDRYYLADPVAEVIYVFNELSLGWSKWTGMKAEMFFDKDGILYCASGANLYTVNTNTSASISSSVKTKDFNLGTDINSKMFEKLIAIFRNTTSASTFELKWYIDGQTGSSGSKSISLQAASVNWDSGGYTWDQEAIRWDMLTINFVKESQRKLTSGITISFGIEATGTNRFNLDSLDLVFEIMKRGGV